MYGQTLLLFLIERRSLVGGDVRPFLQSLRDGEDEEEEEEEIRNGLVGVFSRHSSCNPHGSRGGARSTTMAQYVGHVVGREREVLFCGGANMAIM